MCRYKNFDLELSGYDHTEQTFKVRVVNSPAGDQRLTDAETVYLASGLDKRLRRLEQRHLSKPEFIALGEELAAYLFPHRVLSFLITSSARLSADERLRLRLKLDNHQLADIPWEYAYIADPDTPANQKGVEGFLVLNPKYSLVRYESLQQPKRAFEPIDAEIHMAVLLSNPKGTEDLCLNQEQQNLEEALAGIQNIHMRCRHKITRDDLEKSVIGGIHIFHYAGHGEFTGGPEPEGALLLHGPNDGTDSLTAGDLAMKLRERGIRLAILGACNTGRRDDANVWTGIAPALVHAGIPAVVGMQYSIGNQNAIAFSKGFYAALVRGQTIDEAMTDGRQSIKIDGKERDWGVPVLYLRSDDEAVVLFPKRERKLEVFPKSEKLPDIAGLLHVAHTYQVFLSYASTDREKVEMYYQYLESAGLKPWMESKDILGGQMRELVIRQAIRESNFLMVFLTHQAVSTPGPFHKSLKQALEVWQEKPEGHIYIIPVRLEDCQMPESLQSFEKIDLFEKDGWMQLLRTFQVGIGQ